MKAISARVAPWGLLGLLALGGISCAGDLAEQLRDFDGSLDHEYDWSLNAPDVP